MGKRSWVGLVLISALLMSACGEEGDAEAEGTGTEAEGPSVLSLEEVEQATIQIVAEGSFIDPEFGAYEGSGAGSGFIIDPSGIAVTNNHVVTGSALLEVYVPGEDKPKNAKILGVSECSDLAVIDIDGDGFPSLPWYDGDVSPGLKIYAAGYPLGDPEYTLTSGIVSKADYDIETVWASVDRVIEHDARIRGGNSGGPLVTEDGQVVGINYAGDDQTDQNLAINVAEALPIIQQLRAGDDVTSIGVNGFAVNDGENVSGVWVASVESGSPADEAGIEGGDVITRMEGVTLAEDGTMARYCDILRSREADDVISVEVLRYATSEVLEGQINGDELVQSFSFAQELADDSEGGTGDTYDSYTQISDESGSIQLDVPVEWSEVDGAPFEDESGNTIYDVRASSNLQQFSESWTTPGVIVSASSDLAQSMSETDVLDLLLGDLEQSCTYEGRSPYEDPAYTGQYDVFTACGGTATSYVIAAVTPSDGSYLIAVQVQAVTDRDYDALDRILETFVVVGTV